MTADHPWVQHARKVLNVSLGETVPARLKTIVWNKFKKKALRIKHGLLLGIVINMAYFMLSVNPKWPSFYIYL